MFQDLDRPLGRDLTPRRSRRGVSTAHLGTVAVVLAAIVGSTAIATLQPPLRHVDVFAEIAAAAKAAEDAKRLAAASLTPSAPNRAARPPVTPSHDPSLPTITYPPSQGGGPGETVLVSDPSSMRQSPAMAASMEIDLVEPSDVGPLPIRGADGRRPLDAYSVAPVSDLGTRVAIVVGGLGISQTGTQAAIKALPKGVTLAFSPTGNSLDRWMQEARRSGHELMIQAPMEPFGYPQVSPGPHTLTADDATAGRFDALHWALGRTINYVGIMNYMGARVTADRAAMQPLLTELTDRGLLYLDDASSSRSLARDVARETGAAFAASDVLIDGSQQPDAILKQLETLERVARADGTAIGIASAFDTSVSAIADWIAEAETRGIKIVPISALADDPERR